MGGVPRRLEIAIVDALAAIGKDVEHLVAEDLSPVDEFHVGGRQATAAFVARLGLQGAMHVLDLGCGLGGPARYVAQNAGCRVLGIDLTPEHVGAATALTTRVRLADRVGYVCGDAALTPFPDGSFDVAYMLHVGMYIADKSALFAEVQRLLKPGGVFGIYDIMRIGEGDLTFPLPWASDQAASFIEAPADYRAHFEKAGFVVTHERDRREEGLQCFRDARTAAAAKGVSPLGLHLVMKDFAAKSINMYTGILREIASPTEMIGHRS